MPRLRVRVRADTALLCGLALCVCAGLIALAPPRLEELDAVNFALGLDRFDLARYQPHFPGYPVYLALARATQVLAPDVARALAWPGALALLPAALLLRRGLLAVGAKRSATLAAALLFLATPRLLVEATKPTSDALGSCGIVCVLGLALLALGPRLRDRTVSPQPAALLGAAFLLGLVLGVRASLAPFVLSFAGLCALAQVPRRLAAATALSFLLGLAAWAVPLILLTGPADLLHLGREFLVGHFARWGGTAWTAPSGRLGRGLEALGPLGLGLAGPAALGPAPLGLSLLLGTTALLTALDSRLRPSRRTLALAALVLVPYAAWVAVGQNLEKPRHLLPLVALLTPLWGLALAGAIAGARHRWAPLALPLCAALSLAVASPWLRARSSTPSPAYQLVARLAPRADRVLLFGGEAVRLAQYYAPPLRAYRPGDLAGARRLLASYRDAGAPLAQGIRAGTLELYLASDVAGTAGVSDMLEVVARLRGARGVDPHDATLVLYRVRDLDRLLAPERSPAASLSSVGTRATSPPAQGASGGAG